MSIRRIVHQSTIVQLSVEKFFLTANVIIYSCMSSSGCFRGLCKWIEPCIFTCQLSFSVRFVWLYFYLNVVFFCILLRLHVFLVKRGGDTFEIGSIKIRRKRKVENKKSTSFKSFGWPGSPTRNGLDWSAENRHRSRRLTRSISAHLKRNRMYL